MASAVKKRSAVWDYFDKGEDGKAKCKLCFKRLKFSGNTTNFSQHLLNIHGKNLNAKRGENRKCDGDHVVTVIEGTFSAWCG